MKVTNFKTLFTKVFFFGLLATLNLYPSTGVSLELIKQKTIDLQKKLTSSHETKNGIPVTLRSINGSQLVSAVLLFKTGFQDVPADNKYVGRMMWSLLGRGSVKYPKEKLRGLQEKYAFSLGCGESIEIVSCSYSGIAEYFDIGMDALASMILEPEFDQKEFDNMKDRMISDLKSTESSPETYSNTILNKIFYGQNHPYAIWWEDALKQVEKIKLQDLKDYHKKVVSSKIAEVTISSDMKPSDVMAILNKQLAALPSIDVASVTATDPVFDAKSDFIFEDRDLPTSWIRLKFNFTPLKSPDLLAGALMLDILNERLGEEVRTKRSLSYSTHAHKIQYEIGIGTITSTTAKPQETLKVIHDVITEMRTKEYTAEEIEEYKVSFVTDYFRGLETHGSITSQLAYYKAAMGSTDYVYEFPKILADVTSSDVKRVANQFLKNFRCAVVYSKDKFKEEWFTLND